MQIKPIGREAVSRGFSEHRVVPAETAERNAGGDSDARSLDSLQADLAAGSVGSEPEYRLVDGDRVIVRYLDIEPSRPEFYTLSDATDDPMNGYLLLSSPLGQALAQAAPGDELSFEVGGEERSVLFVSLETAPAQAA
jgi:transcription elongation GreA/GreB family factor